MTEDPPRQWNEDGVQFTNPEASKTPQGHPITLTAPSCSVLWLIGVFEVLQLNLEENCVVFLPQQEGLYLMAADAEVRLKIISYPLQKFTCKKYDPSLNEKLLKKAKKQIFNCKLTEFMQKQSLKHRRAQCSEYHYYLKSHIALPVL